MENWKNNPNVSSETDLSKIEDSNLNFPEKISWFSIKAKMGTTPQEELEKKLAMQEQFRLGIINELGIPVGYTYEELNIAPQQAAEIEAKLLEIRRKDPHYIPPQQLRKPVGKLARRMFREQQKIQKKNIASSVVGKERK